MSILLRKTNGPNRTGAVFTDQALESFSVNIGSSTDSDLQLLSELIAPKHCEIKTSGDKAKLKCNRGHSVIHNGQNCTNAKIAVGDIIDIGGHRIESVLPPSGFDLALKVSLESSKPVKFESLYKTELTQTHLTPRIFTWSMVSAVVFFALLAPLMYYFNSARTENNSSIVSNIPGLNDTIWSSGPLHSAHSALENNCAACHQKLFQKVTSDSCTTCHQSTDDHIVAVTDNPNLPITANDRCATCHREHNEPQSTLIITSDNLCTDCHQQHDLTTASQRPLDTIGGFGKDLHAGFKASLAKPPKDDRFNREADWPIEKIAVASGIDESQLKFNHEYHLGGSDDNPSRIDLSCEDCHALEPAGEHFAATTFEQNCLNSGCHSLELGKRNRIPHALPDAAIATIQGYYLRQVGDSVLSFNTVAENCRRRPGKNNCEEKCTGTPFECATNKATDSIEQHFNRKGCITCHQVDITENADLLDRYRIPAVNIVEDFYPTAAFDHASHQVLIEPVKQTTYTGDQACSYCHEASTSKSSKDLLIPDIDNCVSCHEATSTLANNVPLQCVDCHEYHLTR